MKTQTLNNTEKKVKIVSNLIVLVIAIGAIVYIAKAVSMYAPIMFKF